MTPQEIAAKLEDIREQQLDGSELLDALKELQQQLIGTDALEQMRAERLRAYQQSHPWLYPDLFPDAKRPAVRPMLILPRQMAKEALRAVASMEFAEHNRKFDGEYRKR